MNKNPDTRIFNIEPNHFPWTDPDRDGAYSDLKDYIEFPEKFKSFDFILVDGRARKACMKKALDFVSGKAVVVLHDANREYYHDAFRYYKDQVFFKNYRDSHGLWVGSNGCDLHEVFNVDRHIRLWQVYNKIAGYIQSSIKKK